MIEAIIPCRGGSTRVLGKNIRPFAGSSLLEIKIRQALRVDLFGRVTVNSDDDAMLDLARSLGAHAVRRQEGMGASSVSGSDLARTLSQQATGDVLCRLNCTSPLVSDATIRRCVASIAPDRWTLAKYPAGNGGSVNTVAAVREFLWMDGRPLNYSPAAMPKSQDLPEVLALTFAVELAARDSVWKHGGFIAPVWLPIITDEVESVDIDTPTDFAFAEWLYQQRSIGEPAE